MNRTLLVAAVVFFIAGVLGFVFNVPLAGWALLVVGLLLVVAGITSKSTPTQSMATTDLGPSRDAIGMIPSQGVLNAASTEFSTPGPVNPTAPVNAGPPHIPESRNDPFDNNGPIDAR